MKMMATPFAILVASGLLTACGGGSDGGSGNGAGAGAGGGSGGNGTAPVAKLEGAYQGTTGKQLTINSLTLENGDSWILYGGRDKTSNAVIVTGVTHAIQSSSTSSTYTARTKDYYQDGQVFDGSISGSYVPGQSFRGTITSNGLTTPFTTNAVKASEFNYQTPASLARIAGNWNAAILNGGSGQIAIGADGAITGSLQACSVTGQAQPRASGKNVFDVRLSFGPAPCRLPGQQITGVATSYALAGGGTQLILMGATADGAAGTALLASR